MRPRIAIPHPTSFDFAYNRLNMPTFAQAIHEAGGETIFLDLAAPRGDQALLAASCQGILLPGSPADVSPTTYGQKAEEDTARPDPAREATDRMLIEFAYTHRQPLLAICFGAQMLNVYNGGTLIQHLSVIPVNHSAPRAVAVAHFCNVLEGGLLSELVDPREVTSQGQVQRLPINSSHHQAVGIAGEAFMVCGRSPEDGVVEAFEPRQRSDHFVLGVQWHPERTVAASQTSRNLFARLVDEAR